MKPKLNFEGIAGPINGVLFDLDDTLIDRRAAFRLWLTAAMNHWLRGIAKEERDKEIEHLIEIDKSGLTPRYHFFSYVRDRYRKFNIPPESLAMQYYADILEYTCLALGADQLLRSLTERETPFGIVTNGSDHQMHKAARVGLANQATCILISEHFGYRKPHPHIFLEASKRLNVNPREILFVGDQPDIDIIGAHHFGMRTAWVRHGKAWPECLPAQAVDLICDSLLQITIIQAN
ncbi:HAD family hydrolase [Nonomuraea sp. NPDC050022]|uniref:HAD family hydrolase n=1 Tax=unclassified Nonomuraea TaxID=2593643 RepID=UPI00340B92AB